MRVLKGMLAGVAAVAPMMAPLLVAAGLAPGGTWAWARGWAFVAVVVAMSMGGSAAMAVFRPESFEVRRQGPVAARDKRQPWVDAVGLVAFLAYVGAWFAFIPLDVFWLRLLPAPPGWVSALGGVLAVAGVAIAHLAVAQNRFAAPTVQDQTGDGQRVIDTGLYGVVRHPLYAGNLLLYVGAALWLGSTAALVGVTGMVLFTVARIVVEEAQLRATLPGYAAYAARVRSRLAPGVY